MAGEPILHQLEVSPFCDKVRRILHFKRRRYETRDIPLTEALIALRNLTSTGKVPVLEHEGRMISDSSDIARYLDRTFPEPPLYPNDPRDRALAHVIEDWADESLYFFALWFRYRLRGETEGWSSLSAHSEPPLLRRATERALPAWMRGIVKRQGLGRREPALVLSDFDRHLNAVAAWLGDRSWLVADQPSIADIAVYAQLAGAADTGDGRALLSNHPSVLTWMERVNAITS